MSYRITGLRPDDITPTDARRYVVAEHPGYPCRITLEDAPIGETVLLLNYEHLSGDTPYRASHAIFVREGADRAAVIDDAVPPMLARRALSVRAYDEAHMMLDAAVVDGTSLDARIASMFADPHVAFLHVHTAARGCYLARVDRRRD